MKSSNSVKRIFRHELRLISTYLALQSIAIVQLQLIRLSEAETKKAEITEADIKNIYDYTIETKRLL